MDGHTYDIHLRDHHGMPDHSTDHQSINFTNLIIRDNRENLGFSVFSRVSGSGRREWTLDLDSTVQIDRKTFFSDMKVNVTT